MGHEDLYREVLDQERRDDARFDQSQSMQAIRGYQPKPPSSAEAQRRFNRELKPIFRRLAKMKPGSVKHRRGFVLGDPSKMMIADGPTVEDVKKQIAANPEKFRHLAKRPVEVKSVNASRKEPGNLHRD